MASLLHIGIVISCFLASKAEFGDELQVYEEQCLGEERFHCGDGQCIWAAQHCDGVVHCANEADESFCVIHPQDASSCNATNQFACTDRSQCIPTVYICNNVTDCMDGSDELNCTNAEAKINGTCKGFTCVSDGNCVSRLWACDGVFDCPDRSDESLTACRSSRSPSAYDPALCYSPVQKRGELPRECLDKSYCLPQSLMCDGTKDCKDGSDEGTFCQHWHTMCKNFTCGNDSRAFCLPDRTGPYCYCETGDFNPATVTCDVTDLCQEARPFCAQKCQFVNGTKAPKCSCDDGYAVDDRNPRACFAPDPEALLFFSTRTSISYVKLKSKQVVTLLTARQAHGVASVGEFVYWVETADGHEAVVKARVSDGGHKEVLVGLGLGLEDPGDVAVDWQGGHIYFSDAERGVISACRTDKKICTTIKTDARVPKFVTLDPGNGKMYWADWHNSGPVIVSADMDGGRPCPLLAKDTLRRYPTGLALDAPSSRLYFVDGTVKAVNLESGRIFTLFEEQIYHPYTLSVFENTLYWSDWASNTIQAADKTTGRRLDMVYKFDSAVMGMHVYHPILMRAKFNPCAAANCSHFCFVTSNQTYVCACADGFSVVKNMCIPNNNYQPTYVVVGGGARFTRVQYNGFGSPEAEATTFDIGHVQAMAYDCRRDTLYMYDRQRKSINSIRMGSFRSGITKFLAVKGFDDVVDMDYDYVTDSLYILDAGRKHIEVVSLRTMKQALVYRFDDETPISFCVLADHGKMLVAVLENGANEIHIDSFGLDGSGRQAVVLNDLKGPQISLRYARNLNLVYVADEGNRVIGFMHPEGSGRDTYRALSTPVTGLSVTDNLVLWSGQSASRVYWADAHEASPRIRRIELSSFPNTTRLHLQSTFPPPPHYPHPCDTHVCSDICVQTSRKPHQDPGYTCLCPAGLFLLDGICTEPVDCKESEAFCHRSNMCVPKTKVCDGKKDCFNGEDEIDCPAPTQPSNIACAANEVQCNDLCLQRDEVCSPAAFTIPITCTSAEFACSSHGVCIERSQMCDRVPDCPDGSDEAAALCNTLSCLRTEFLCSSGSCILNSFKCDGEDDCSDGSDELYCGRRACPPGSFQCRNSECVEVKRRCDHHSDCSDYSDEEGCGDTSDVLDTKNEIDSCAAWEHTCELNTTICIPLASRCNGKMDCPGSTDERHCNDHCASRGLFECRPEGKCLTRDKVCNGKKECSDGSDEAPLVCERANRSVRLFPIHAYPKGECRDGYTCENGQCVEWREVCDHQPSCFDGSDESPLCFTACENHTCSHKCLPTPKGPECRCPAGFTADGGACRDIDECAHEPCSQRCVNTPGSFLCACHRGYAIRSDRRSCKAIHGPIAVLYVSGNSVRSLTADGQPAVEYNDPAVGSVTDIDCDVRRHKLYLTSAEAGKLIEVNSTKNEIAVTNIGRPTRIAADWITGNVYFVDGTPNAGHVRVCHVQKKRCAKLQRLPGDAVVTSLVLDPASRLMFYCTSQQESVVWSATLSGRNVSPIATGHNCTGLAVDSFRRRLYLAQTAPASVTVMDFQGGGQKAILQDDPHLDAPHGLAIFEDHIYYLVANSITLSRCLLYGQKRSCEVYLRRIFDANTFVIRHESVQRDDLLDVCVGFPCDNVCVMDVTGPVCLCDDGSQVKDGGCPLVKKVELPLFNGWTVRDFVSANKVSHTIVISVLIIFVLYLGVFGYYRCVYKKKKERAENYIPVHFHNSMTDIDGLSPFASPLMQNRPLIPAAGSSTGDFMNPLEFVKGAWRNSFRKPKNTSALKFDVRDVAPQADFSDTESDIDERENRINIRRKSNHVQV